MPQMTDGSIIERHFENEHYKVLFNQKTGFFVRCEDEGFPEPRWSSHGPELIDLSITNYCERNCAFCYRKTLSSDAYFMSIEDVENVVKQAASCGTMQIALGGGNPNQHPNFVEILRTIRQEGIVPSYTTNGDGLTDEVLKATEECCGAMAVSVYPPFAEERYGNILGRMAKYHIRVNLHAIIIDETLDMWMRWLLKPPSFFRDVNAVIFLNYKPVKGGFSQIGINRARTFFETVSRCQNLKIGFDSCCISGIVQWMKVPACLVESCEAARVSAFISEKMRMYPCSFMVDNKEYGDLSKEKLGDVWQENALFKRFREDSLHSRCTACQHAEICRGGCRLYEQINWC